MPHSIRSAGMLVIGDEVLNGKIFDTNSHEFARFCFEKLQVPVKRMIVCGDDQQDIVSSLNSLSDCSIVFTLGGIGSTHDDVTYAAVAAAYGLPLSLDLDTVAHMRRLRGNEIERLDNTSLSAYFRMATLPTGPSVTKTYVLPDLWVPVVGLDHKVYILPGVPQLFKRLLHGMFPILKPRVEQQEPLIRRYVKTSHPEHSFASFLEKLQNDLDAKHGKGSVKLGSYPHLSWRVNTISIILTLPSTEVDLLVTEVAANVDGKEITAEEELNLSENEPEGTKN